MDAPPSVTAGSPFDVTVTALDNYGHVAAGYTGTVTFSASDPDPGVVLPADYTFTADEGGVHTFTDTGLGETTLVTPGDQTLTATDTADGSLAGSTIITVNSAPPAPSPGPSPAPVVPGRSLEIAPTAAPQLGPGAEAVDRFFASLKGEDSRRIALRSKHAPPREAAWSMPDFFGDEEGLHLGAHLRP